MDKTNEHNSRQSEHESTVNVDNVYSSDTVNPIQDEVNNDPKLSLNVSPSPSPPTSIINLTRNETGSDVGYNNECSPLPLTDNQESIKLANSSNLNEKQPEMDCLLEKLRKGMTELSHQGDDFTKQMWNMYATFEDMISGSGQRDDRSRSTLMELSSTSSLSINPNSTSSKDSDNNSKTCTVPLTPSVTNVSHSESISSSSSPETENQTGKANVNNYKEMSTSQQTKESTVVKDTPQLVTSLSTGDESSTENGTTNSDSNDKSQKFRPIPVNRNKFLAARQSNIDKASTNLVGYQSDSGSNSSLANPLLDTISCLTSSDPYSDSDDYDVTRSKVINQRARRRCRRMLSDRSLRCSPNHLHSCCSSDADSIGYAGSNSIDSGYKSLCPTPEVPESITNLLPYKTADMSSVSDKLQITAQQDNSCIVMVSSHSSSSISALQRLTSLNTISNNSKPHYSDSLSKSKLSSMKPHDARITSNCCGPSLINSTSSNSVSSLYNNKMVTRLKNQSSQAHLEHLLTLRQSLISAIQKCESSTSTPTDSRVASPVISSRSTSPASTVIPRTVSNLKITPGLASLSSSLSVGVIQGANTSNQIYQQSSIISGSLSPSSSIAASSNASTIMSKSKRLPAPASPEPWYSQSHYSPLTSYHQNGHTSLNCTRYNRINNPPSQIHDHQSIEPVLTSSAVSTDVGRVTPTQLPPATSLDVIGQQQQHYSSSSLTSLTSSSSFNKSVRFDEVMITPFTNYQPATLNISSNSSLEIADYPIQTTERPISLAATNTSSVAQIAVTSGHLNTDSSASSINDNRVNGITDSNNSNNIINNDNINKLISNSNNSNSIYNGINNGIGSSSSIKSSAVTFSTKSILKDPICANLRSSIESGMFNPAQSLENEIDSLLYGKRFNDPIALPTTQISSNDPEFTSLSTLKESNDLYKQAQDDPLDIPYVKMIEEKYRAGNKINKTKSQEHATETFTSYTENTNNHHPSDPMSLDEGINEINVATYQSESSNYLYHKNLNHSGSQASLNHQNGKYQKQRPTRNGMPPDNTDAVLDPMSKSKISEMAKCMLGILDEIEMKNSIENRLPKLETVRLREKCYTTRTKERSRPSSAEFRSSIELMPNLLNNGETASESSYHSLPEYHIYEEVAYDYMMDNHPIRSSPNTVKEAPISQPVHPRERSRRILPPNPISSMTMLNNSRITGKSGSSLYRSPLKDLLKPCDGNNNPRLTSNVNINEREVTLNGNDNCLLETELKCFRSSSSSPLSSMRTSSLINSTTSWGRVTEQPKQRGNLYSLFTDPNQRINIGRSLRKELNYNQPRSTIHLELCNQMDGSSSSSEYGFKNN